MASSPHGVSMKRRRFLSLSIAGLVVGSGIAGYATYKKCEDDNTVAFLGCARDGNDSYVLTGANAQGEPCYTVPLSTRGHGVAIDRIRDFAFIFSRRPGEFITVVEIQTGKLLSTYSVSDRYHLYGHGVVVGDKLYTSEGERATSNGVIGIYQIWQDGTLDRVGEHTGFGLGPHEIMAIDHSTLALAVGGVQTQGREPLNIETMSPSLVLIDIHFGKVLGIHTLPDHQMSIRHLAMSTKGEIVTAQQYRGSKDDVQPLLAIRRLSGEYQQLVATTEQWSRFNQYIGSVACTESQIVATSPRGNCYGIWNIESGELEELGPLLDASGAAAKPDRFALSAGSGRLVIQNVQKNIEFQTSEVHWDNHWVML
ncbi:DUF1513 domain-containing protein [Enterovibrio norvegicus]|uniref:DUF1513 domain-containing protein n=1 Tax=Enterovibrio norvegicus TaxID=188144 RepID=UPI001F53DE83|nr:DUF1513 domain-containing protein [Enterovibrio norvegicus]